MGRKSGCDEWPRGFEVDFAVLGEEGGEGGLLGKRTGGGSWGKWLDL